jgi:hypothetical protein
MTLKKIEHRLALFPDYLRYRADNWQATHYGRKHTLRVDGIIDCRQLLNFDQWLFQNRHEDLICGFVFLPNPVR